MNNNKASLIFFFLLLTVSQSFATTTDSLLKATIHLDQPYLLIDLTAKDCINCKSNAFSLFSNFCKERILILSDSKLMDSYLKRNSNIDSTIQFVYQKKLSETLSAAGLSSVCLVANNTICKYKLDASFEKVVDSLRKIINVNCGGNQMIHNKDIPRNITNYPASSTSISETAICKDTLGAVDPIICSFRFDGKEYLLYNYKFQIGMTADLSDRELRYHYLTLDTNLRSTLHQLTRENDQRDSLLPALRGKKLLKKIGQPEIALVSFDAESLLTYYNACYQAPDISDTEKHVRVTHEFFLMTHQGLSFHQPFNLKSYSKIY